MSNGAMTLAEGSQKKDYRTDATMVLNGNTERGYVLRTAYDPLPVWKAKYGKGISPFYPRLKSGIKEAALIDDEIWVFGIDGTNVNDLISAVTIGTEFYKVSPQYLLASIYIKNLNAEGERGMDLKTLVSLNEALYQKTVAAIRDTCKHFGVRQDIKIHVYSANVNPKISKEQLHKALMKGGANSVETDSRALSYRSGSNDGERRAKIETNLHIATVRL